MDHRKDVEYLCQLFPLLKVDFILGLYSDACKRYAEFEHLEHKRDKLFEMLIRDIRHF